MATRDWDAGRYQRHRPEQTLLYRIVDEYYPAFAAHLEEQGRELPGYVQREFEDYLKCGHLERLSASVLRVLSRRAATAGADRKPGHGLHIWRTGSARRADGDGAAAGPARYDEQHLAATPGRSRRSFLSRAEPRGQVSDSTARV